MYHYDLACKYLQSIAVCQYKRGTNVHDTGVVLPAGSRAVRHDDMCCFFVPIDLSLNAHGSPVVKCWEGKEREGNQRIGKGREGLDRVGRSSLCLAVLGTRIGVCRACT